MSPARAWAVVAALVFCLPSVARAHLVTSGLGPFYDGTLHLLLSPGDLLGLLAASLLAGLRGARAARLTVLALPAAWLAAGLLGLALPPAVELPWAGALSLVLLGAAVALDPRLPPAAVAALAGLYGALQGLLNGAALAAVGAGPLSLLGIVLTAGVLALLVPALVLSLSAAWARIAVRVAGSWLAAVGILMLGWLIRGFIHR